jgi:hypothetical protein
MSVTYCFLNLQDQRKTVYKVYCYIHPSSSRKTRPRHNHHHEQLNLTCQKGQPLSPIPALQVAAAVEDSSFEALTGSSPRKPSNTGNNNPFRE